MKTFLAGGISPRPRKNVNLSPLKNCSEKGTLPLGIKAKFSEVNATTTYFDIHDSLSSSLSTFPSDSSSSPVSSTSKSLRTSSSSFS
jgi:hypothetical protein